MWNVGQVVPGRAGRGGVVGVWIALVLCWAAACGGGVEDGSGVEPEAPDETSAGSGGRGSGAGAGQSEAGTASSHGLGGHQDGGDCCTGAPAPDAYCQAPAVSASPEAAEVIPNDVEGSELLVDEQGDSYVVGTTSSEPGFYLLKLGADTGLVWSRYLGDESASYGAALRFASNGDLLVGAVVSQSTSAQRIAIFRYDRAGALIAERVIAQPNGPEGASDPRLQIFDNGEDLEIWGSFSGSWSVASTTLEATSALDIYRIRLTPSGEVVDAAQFDRANYNRINHGVTDGSGTTYLAVAGQVASAVDTEPMLVALDDTLTPIWEHPLENEVVPYRLVHNDGTLVVAGLHLQMLFLGTLDAATGETVSWTEIARASAVTSLSLLPDANIVLGGQAPSTTNFGGELLDSNLGEGPFVAAFSALGDHQWSTLYCLDGPALKALSYAGGTLKGLLTFSGQLELDSIQLSEGSSALLTLPTTGAGAGGAGGVGGALGE